MGNDNHLISSFLNFLKFDHVMEFWKVLVDHKSFLNINYILENLIYVPSYFYGIFMQTIEKIFPLIVMIDK